MSELLRLANKLVDETENSIIRGKDIENIYNFADDTIEVIKGYQDLIRRMIDTYEGDFSLFPIVDEARASIPQEQSNE